MPQRVAINALDEYISCGHKPSYQKSRTFACRGHKLRLMILERQYALEIASLHSLRAGKMEALWDQFLLSFDGATNAVAILDP
jgi:hypothetical protein